MDDVARTVVILIYICIMILVIVLHGLQTVNFIIIIKIMMATFPDHLINVAMSEIYVKLVNAISW